MTIAPNPYDIIRAIQDQQAVMLASYRASERLVTMLAGMLDASAPDPLIDWNPPIQFDRPVAADEWQPRAKARSNRPTRKILVAGTPVIVSEMRAQMVEALKERPRTTEEIVALKLSVSADAVRKAFVALNFDFSKLGIPLRIKPVERVSRVGPKGGSILPRYALIDPESTNANPDIPPSVQSEAEAGSSPEQEADARAGGEGKVIVPAQSAPFVMPAGGEGASRVEPPLAADAELPALKPANPSGGSIPLGDRDLVKSPFESGRVDGCSVGVGGTTGIVRSDGGERPAPKIAIVSGREKVMELWAGPNAPKAEIAALTKVQTSTVRTVLSKARKDGDPRAIPESERPAAPLSPAMVIEPGDLLAVDINFRRIQTPKGRYEVGGANLARALDMMKGGHMFGLDVIAKKAGWPTAEVARTALGFERNRLAQHGLDLWMDKFNARLRVPA